MTERAAQPGEHCTCGRQAVTVFMRDNGTDVGYCGLPDGGERTGPCPFCGGERHRQPWGDPAPLPAIPTTAKPDKPARWASMNPLAWTEPAVLDALLLVARHLRTHDHLLEPEVIEVDHHTQRVRCRMYAEHGQELAELARWADTLAMCKSKSGATDGVTGCW